MRVDETTITEHNPGYVSYNQTVTGLTSGTSYEFRLLLRKDSGSTLVYPGGAITATKL
jgi:hypothetical protein